MKRPSSDTEEQKEADLSRNVEPADTPKKRRRPTNQEGAANMPTDDRPADDDSSKPSPHAKKPSSSEASSEKASNDSLTAPSRPGKAKEDDEENPESDAVGEDESGKKWLEFPAKLMDLLQRGVAPDAIWFLPEGKAIGIHKENFIEKILDEHFRGNKFTSAIRMFNHWGFRRISHPSLKDKEIGFHHLLFRRDAPDLVDKMKKNSVASEVILQLEMAGNRTTESQSLDVFSGQGSRINAGGSMVGFGGQGTHQQRQQEAMAQQALLYSGQLQQQQQLLNPFPYQGLQGGFNQLGMNMQQQNPMLGSAFAQQQFQYLQQQQQQAFAQFPSNFAINNPAQMVPQQQQMQSHASGGSYFGFPASGMLPAYSSLPTPQQQSFASPFGQVSGPSREESSGGEIVSIPFQAPLHDQDASDGEGGEDP